MLATNCFTADGTLSHIDSTYSLYKQKAFNQLTLCTGPCSTSLGLYISELANGFGILTCPMFSNLKDFMAICLGKAIYYSNFLFDFTWLKNTLLLQWKSLSNKSWSRVEYGRI